LIRVQRLINIKMAKAYRTVSHEALCILTGMTPTEKRASSAILLSYQEKHKRQKTV
jgi:hypothetical protein